MNRLLCAAALCAASALAAPAFADQTPSSPGAKVYFVNLQDGDTVPGDMVVNFGLSGMGVAPAGVEMEGTGHHHLIIDEAIEGDELKEGIPADDNHRHFGGGQTETVLNLEPGTYVLQLVLGDQNHIPHEPAVMSERITITVE